MHNPTPPSANRSGDPHSHKPADPAALDLIRRWAAELGFQQLGVADLDLSSYAAHLHSYLERGHHGDMGYLARNQLKRLNPAQLVPGTARVISARMNYLPAGTEPLRVLQNPAQAYVSRYALGRDYHKLIRRRLSQLANRINTHFGSNNPRNPKGENHAPASALRAFTDSAPVLEKALGAKAGLGWIGKHTLLLNKEVGSWFFLGELFTSLDLPCNDVAVTDGCGNCKACMTVCPTDAIVGPQQLDARRCISYLTIEHKGSIPVELRASMGNRVFGCDDCQLFCPWNRTPDETTEADFSPRHTLDQASLVELFSWSAVDFDERTRGSAIRRISYEQWQRNLAVGLGNGPASADAVAALAAQLPRASALLGEHINWALEQLDAKR